MEKRYQVFISSTFQDLEGARQEVSQALLRADCFPAGMELFPAADEEQFAFIKQVIQQSDYYIVISAGRYGSIHPETGLSYTEMEYDYAVEIEKPVIRLLHKDPFNRLTGDKIEKTAKGRKALEKFREKLSTGRLVKFWLNEFELGTSVDHSLRHVIRTANATGWVRSDGRATAEVELELANTKRLLAELRQKVAETELDTERRENGYLDSVTKRLDSALAKIFDRRRLGDRARDSVVKAMLNIGTPASICEVSDIHKSVLADLQIVNDEDVLIAAAVDDAIDVLVVLGLVSRKSRRHIMVSSKYSQAMSYLQVSHYL